MPDIADDNWSERDDRNSELAPNGWPPGLPASIETIGQMMMGALKRSYNRYNPIYQTTGSADSYVITTEGQQSYINLFEIIRARIDRANTTTAPSLKYAGTAARTIMKYAGNAKVALSVGDLVTGRAHDFWYDGTNWILNNPSTVTVSNISDLGTIATQNADAVAITGGSITGITDLAVADGGTGASTAAQARTNLGAAASGANSDITSITGLTTALSITLGGTGATTQAAARTNLGLGTAATQNTGTSGANVPLLNGANTWSAAQSFSSLSSSTPIPASSGGTGQTSVGTAISANTGTSGHAVPFLDGTNTWSRTQTISPGTWGGTWVSVPAGTGGQLIGQRNGVNRWEIRLPSESTESGSNSGGDFEINRFNDAGTFIDAPLTITRSTGVVTLSQPLPVGSGGTGVTTSTGSGSNVLSASPALTGTPTAPTAVSTDNSTTIATTAFFKQFFGTSSITPASGFSAGSAPNAPASIRAANLVHLDGWVTKGAGTLAVNTQLGTVASGHRPTRNALGTIVVSDGSTNYEVLPAGVDPSTGIITNSKASTINVAVVSFEGLTYDVAFS